MALPYSLASISQSDIEQLISSKEQEGTHLDLKRSLPINWDNASKHEFLADSSAFANSGGGDLIYGVDEDGEASASAIVPQTINPDVEVRRLQDILLNGIEPRLPGCQIVPVPVSVSGNSGSIIIVRIPKSWAGPHRVRTNQHFYLREGARKRQLDVPELRGLFLRSESQGVRIRDFRADRISKILTNEAPCNLENGSIMVMHLVPTQAALNAINVEPTQYARWAMREKARNVPLLERDSNGGVKINIDGAVNSSYSSGSTTFSYSILFRSGFLEAVKVYSTEYPDRKGYFVLPGEEFESVCIGLVKSFRAELGILGLSKEMVALFSILHANKIAIGFDRFSYGANASDGRFDRQHILLPEVVLPAEIDSEKALRPLFDLLWQSGGMARSINYNDNGDWAPRRR